MNMLKPKMVVFNDVGATSLCVSQLCQCLEQTISTCVVKKYDSHDVIKNKFSGIDLFCVGGGFTRGVMQSMTEVGIRNIYNYVENGGKFLGICSGAYFASRITEFDINGPLEIIDNGFLNFFNGIARGPAFPGYQCDSEVGSHAVEIERCINKPGLEETFTAYFNGGCEFLDLPCTNATAWYKYGDLQTPTIITCEFGKGKALLSGVHFEFDPFNLPELDGNPYTARLLPSLQNSDASRRKFCISALNYLLGTKTHS